MDYTQKFQRGVLLIVSSICFVIYFCLVQGSNNYPINIKYLRKTH